MLRSQPKEAVNPEQSLKATATSAAPHLHTQQFLQTSVPRVILIYSVTAEIGMSHFLASLKPPKGTCTLYRPWTLRGLAFFAGVDFVLFCQGKVALLNRITTTVTPSLYLRGAQDIPGDLWPSSKSSQVTIKL